MKKISKNLKKFIFTILLGIFVLAVAYPNVLFFWPWASQKLNEVKINLGLDLQGGIHLEYKADLSQIEDDKKDEAMQAVQDVIERRVNAFGVAEPSIYTAIFLTSWVLTKLAGQGCKILFL